MSRELQELGIEINPFSFETLSKRLGYVDLDRRSDDDAALPAAEEGEGDSEAG
jgi:hypothetical protein